jgi:hypothetical protein
MREPEKKEASRFLCERCARGYVDGRPSIGSSARLQSSRRWRRGLRPPDFSLGNRKARARLERMFAKAKHDTSIVIATILQSPSADLDQKRESQRGPRTEAPFVTTPQVRASSGRAPLAFSSQFLGANILRPLICDRPQSGCRDRFGGVIRSERRCRPPLSHPL